MTFKPAHKPGGTPDGGQFTAPAHTEPDLTLGSLPGEMVLHDADGTEWDWVDPNTLEAGSVNGMGILVDGSQGVEGRFGFTVIDYDHDNKPVYTGTAGTLVEAKEAAKDARYIAARYVQGSPPLKVGDRTPWGAADHVENVAPGIDRADTPGHGGYRLSEARNADVDGYWRNHNGWYEEDSEWTIAAITHREAFSAADVKLAHESARAHNPDNYMRVVGRNPAKYGVTDYQPVGPGESPVLAARSFFAAHSRDVQRVWSGVSSDTHPGMVEATVSAVKKDGTRGEHKARVVLIPQADYDGLGGDTFHTIRKDAGYQPLGANAK